MNGYALSSLAYCSNVHPGEQLDDVIDNINIKFNTVRVQRGLSKMASGLWLSAKAANALVNDVGEMPKFKQALANSGMQLTSLNGFPFGNFHQNVVKKSVYLPDWSQPERLVYSKNLAKILVACLPRESTQGAISTLPLAYAAEWNSESHTKAITQLIELTCFLKELEQETGKHICFGIEMEPDCVLENTAQFVKFFQDDLLPAARTHNVGSTQILRYLGCCFDTCHQAVMNENIEQSLATIEGAGIHLCKIQLSNAVSANISNERQIKQLTELFFDEKFLHQTKIVSLSEGEEQQQNITALPDLTMPALMTVLRQTQDTGPQLQVKIHYHIPIHRSDFSLDFLASTQYAILQALDYLHRHHHCRPVLEIETYTWLNLLADKAEQNNTLITGLLNEFNWLQAELAKRELLE